MCVREKNCNRFT